MLTDIVRRDQRSPTFELRDSTVAPLSHHKIIDTTGDPLTVRELETVVLEGYRAGLRSAGWEGDERLLRLGYAAHVALWWGAMMPGWTDVMLGEEAVGETTQQYGRPADEIAFGWLTLWEYAHERAEEARRLIDQLGLA